jgi:predicted metalloenzyme YecM
VLSALSATPRATHPGLNYGENATRGAQACSMVKKGSLLQAALIRARMICALKLAAPLLAIVTSVPTLAGGKTTLGYSR